MSASTSTFKLCVLWQEELRTAAKAIQYLAALADDTPDDVHSQAASDALRACLIALQGAEDDGAVLALVSAHDPLARGSMAKAIA